MIRITIDGSKTSYSTLKALTDGLKASNISYTQLCIRNVDKQIVIEVSLPTLEKIGKIISVEQL